MSKIGTAALQTVVFKTVARLQMLSPKLEFRQQHRYCNAIMTPVCQEYSKNIFVTTAMRSNLIGTHRVRTWYITSSPIKPVSNTRAQTRTCSHIKQRSAQGTAYPNVRLGIFLYALLHVLRLAFAQ